MKSANQIRKEGIDALIEALGVVDAIKFMEQFDVGKGNYTEERNKWLKQDNIDEIVEEMRKK
jgi:hypothetical protein